MKFNLELCLRLIWLIGKAIWSSTSIYMHIIIEGCVVISIIITWEKKGKQKREHITPRKRPTTIANEQNIQPMKIWLIFMWHTRSTGSQSDSPYIIFSLQTPFSNYIYVSSTVGPPTDSQICITSWRHPHPFTHKSILKGSSKGLERDK